jgi:hypothetical protein
MPASWSRQWIGSIPVICSTSCSSSRTRGSRADIRRAFVVYLASHNWPVQEVLFPSLRAVRQEFEHNFAGMTVEPVELDTLLAARERRVHEVQQGLTADERRFLLSLVAAEPE